MSDCDLSRRNVIAAGVSAAITAPLLRVPAWALAPEAIALVGTGRPVSPVPLKNVRLKSSLYADAISANTGYILSLDPHRLLHNFYESAGLPTKGPVYGGWENRGIAGHTLGHYLSATSLLVAQTGDRRVSRRLDETLKAMAACQAAHGDGYVGGTTVERDGEVVDGKIIFEEIRRGEIRTSGFDINGGWVPLYTWHKVQAGLIDAVVHGEKEAARPILIGMSDYLYDVLDGLSHEQMQRLLASEFGGLNEAFANTFALTGDEKYLKMAQRLHHDAVLDPLSAGENNLPGLHANTQIPKLVGLARIAELTGDAEPAETADFFFDTVWTDHTYAIGGNSEREHFRPPGEIASALTDRTCEACNTYNMMRLARHLYAREPDARWFDRYERMHLNHIMAHQDPSTGMFVYFMPMSSGARRTYSQPEDSFWCCVGSGLESHAKHGDSVYWQSGETLFVNLFVPSQLDWTDGGMRLDLDTAYPFEDSIELTVRKAGSEERTIAVRLPGWSDSPQLALNGETVPVEPENGYAKITRRWRRGDTLTLKTPMRITRKSPPDDDRMLTFAYGPMVLAADLGSAEGLYDGLPPAIVASDTGGLDLRPIGGAPASFRLASAGGETLTLKPFFNLYDRRTAVYFPLFTEQQWAEEAEAFRERQAMAAALEQRTVDVIYLGEMQPERDHNFKTNQSDVVAFGGRNGRQAWWGVGNFIEFDLAVREGPMILRVLYWGQETNKNFFVSIDGSKIADERRHGPPKPEFVAVDYPIPENLTAGKDTVRVRFETNGSDAPVYEARVLSAAS